MRVSIAKAIPSLLEPAAAVRYGTSNARFNRESDSVTVGALRSHTTTRCLSGFNRESDSVTVGAPDTDGGMRDELTFQSRKRFRHCWSKTLPGHEGDRVFVSIAKAIPSLLERCPGPQCRSIVVVSIAKAIPSLLERSPAPLPRRIFLFQSRKRFRHCWSRFTSGLQLPTVEVSIAKAIPSLLELGAMAAYATS